ncbi:MAG: GNAT family N-acetyltransferase [Clostridiales bacterium]|nr:GNAT family N-acetyltransferase [Clostridiales bacterium]
MDWGNNISININNTNKKEYIIRDKSKINIGRILISEINNENKNCSVKFNFYRKNNKELLTESLIVMLKGFFKDIQINKVNVYLNENMDMIPFLNVGFTLEGIISNNIYSQGQFYNEIIMGINRYEFFQNNNMEYTKICTKNLILRILTPADDKIMLDYYINNKKHLEKFEPSRDAQFYTLEVQKNILNESYRQFINGVALDFGIFLNDELIGKIKLSNIVYGIFKSAIIGYSIDKEHEGHGYMKEALTSVINYAFEEMNLHRIEASALVDNEKSKRVLMGCGFRELGLNKKYLYINGKWRDHITYYKIK